MQQRSSSQLLMHFPNQTSSMRNPFLPCWLPPGGCDTAKSPQRVPNVALSESAMGLGSWGGADKRNSLNKPQTCLPEPTCSHWSPLVTCPKYLVLNTFFFPFWVVRFLFLPWEKQVAISGACGTQAYDGRSTPCMEDEIHSLCARGTGLCLCAHSACMAGRPSPTRVLMLEHGMASAPQAQGPALK